MSLARNALLALSTNRWLRERATRTAFVRRSISTFMPGERLDDAMAAAQQQQGQGIGQLLLRFVENEVRRQRGRMLLIETSSKESYASTMRFYERSGYDEISRIKDFYRIEDDKVVFCKKLVT